MGLHPLWGQSRCSVRVKLRKEAHRIERGRAPGSARPVVGSTCSTMRWVLIRGASRRSQHILSTPRCPQCHQSANHPLFAGQNLSVQQRSRPNGTVQAMQRSFSTQSPCRSFQRVGLRVARSDRSEPNASAYPTVRVSMLGRRSARVLTCMLAKGPRPPQTVPRAHTPRQWRFELQVRHSTLRSPEGRLPKGSSTDCCRRLQSRCRRLWRPRRHHWQSKGRPAARREDLRRVWASPSGGACPVPRSLSLGCREVAACGTSSWRSLRRKVLVVSTGRSKSQGGPCCARGSSKRLSACTAPCAQRRRSLLNPLDPLAPRLDSTRLDSP